MNLLRILMALFVIVGLARAEDLAPEVTADKQIAYLKIEGVIDPGKAAYIKRAVAQAIAAKVDAMVVHLTTPGGRVDSAEEITKTILGVPEGGPLMVAYIDRESYSAGSLIAYAHQRIYVTSVATLGNIGVIFQTPEGKIEYAPEKAETVVRALLRSVAQKNGWNEAMLQKMTARNQDLYRFESDEGPIYVIEDDLPRFLADNPNRKEEEKVLILGEDRLLSYTAKEAIDYGMATGQVKDLDDLYRTLGGNPASVINLAPTATEELSWLLGSFAPLLAALAVLFVIMELKTPGVGIWAILAGISGLLFFICQFYLELASYPEVLLVIFGIGLLILELFILPTGGWLAITGVVLGMSGLVLAFMPDDVQFNPGSDDWGQSLMSAFASSLLALLVGAGGLVALLLALPKLAVTQHLASVAEITATASGEANTSTSAALVGRRATTRTALSPNGFITIDDRDVGAIAEHGEFIAAGKPVDIIDMQFGEAVVRLREDATT